ncbi:MAG: hypothetical protein A2X36_00975 [Elusimicrobia bacterium GWA2_69_24]|nr:MAG: hypothetical protein A2X36_00975 [Elusimicrobia bacterium GWA2_69_24]HBL17224.1 hypothetical protein [Elusimicrobiota bacterium]
MVKRIWACAAALSFLTTGAGAELTLPELPSLAAVQEILAQKADEIGHVWMFIRPGSGGGSYSIEDSFLRVRLDARGRGDGEFAFSGWVDDEWFDLDSRRIFAGRKDYSLNGFGANLDLRQWGNFGKDYLLTGNIRLPDHRDFRVNVTFHYDDFRKAYDVSGDGLGVRLDAFSGWQMNGSVNLTRFPRTALAAVGAAATLVINDTRPEREPKGGAKGKQ